ncbi:MAG TPA: NfeD family protein [Pyrinomonadaceae bacterium]|jgi:membrane protein implicated in regulation of membrane protease activity
MTDFSLMTIFLAIGGLGFLFLLASLIIGDLFDAIGFDFATDLDASHDFGVFDSRVIAIFLTAFGGFGAIGVSLGFAAAASTLFGVLGGVAFGALVFYFGRFLYRQQASSSVAEEDLIGRTAQVVVPIHAGQIGQIACRIGEERIEKIARARGGAEIKAGQLVYIEEITGDSVIVSVDDGNKISLFSGKEQ